MSLKRTAIGLGIAAALVGLSGLTPTGAAADEQQQKNAPPSRVESRRYPSGSSIREVYKTPDKTVNMAAAAPAGPGMPGPVMASAAAAQRVGARVVGVQAATRRFQLAPLYSTRVGIIAEALAPAGAPVAAAARVDDAAVLAAQAEGAEEAKYVVSYELLHKGIPLATPSSSTALIGSDGRILFIRERNLPKDVEIPTEATVSADDAVKAGRDDLKGDANLQASKPSLEIWVDGEQNAHLTWSYTLASAPNANAVVRRYWVSARGEAKILYSEDMIYNGAQPPGAEAQAPADAAAQAEHADFPFPIPLPGFSGRVTGTIWPPRKSPTSSPSGQAGFPLPFLTISRNGVPVGTTSAAGSFLFPGFGSANLSAGLSGLFCVVENKAGPVISVSKSGVSGIPINLVFNDSGEQQIAQVSVYFWTNVARQFASRVFVPMPPGPGRLDKLPARVNINDTCNAFWDGSAINFFKSDGCPNTAYGDVVLHEYGHGIDAALGGILDGAYSEGFGDSVAILVLRDPLVGRDFFGPGQTLRDARDVITWPPSNPEVHFAGRVYAGFTWELTRQLLNKHGNPSKAFAVAADLTLGAAALNPRDIPDAVALMFKVDDNDNNPNNGTPHAAEIKAAAQSRHIPVPPPF